uniref:Uncharacterized protein n=1 Tax=Rhizophora mucronata TaxID=61149 RepID=A0A2P2J274_RHIMU
MRCRLTRSLCSSASR